MFIEHTRDVKKSMKVGIVIPTLEDREEDPERHSVPPYESIRDLALKAEEASFDSVWLFDHLLFRGPNRPTVGIWECWTLLAALAEATKHIELGTLVLCTAFRNPAVLAKMAVTLDAVSGGRFVLGLGAGWHKPEFDAFGIPFDRRVDRFEEALQIIVPLLRVGEVDFHGTHYSASNCELRPRGIRPNGPPILVAAFKPRMLRLAARYADMWNTCWLGKADTLIPRRDALRQACAEEQRDSATLAMTVGVRIIFQESVDEITPETMDGEPTLTGTPAQIAAAFYDYMALGVTHLICRVDALDDSSLRQLAESLNLYRAMA